MEFLRNAISIQKNIENSGRPHREEPYFRGQTRDIHGQRQGAYPGFCQALPVKFMYISILRARVTIRTIMSMVSCFKQLYSYLQTGTFLLH